MPFVFSIILSVTMLCACDKKSFFDGPDSYHDDFEAYQTLSELLLDNDVYWSLTQMTRASNSISVDTEKVHTGRRSLAFSAAASDDDGASKSSITKHNMAFWQGETVRLSAWYLLEGTQPCEWLFLMDLEEQAVIGAGPGIRLAVVNNQLRINYKFNERDILQNTGRNLSFPKDRWVQLIWEVKLSQKKEGSIKLWQDNELIIDKSNIRTLPEDLLYFVQGTKGMYSSVEFGITANTRDRPLKLWMDEVRVDRVP